MEGTPKQYNVVSAQKESTAQSGRYINVDSFIMIQEVLMASTNTVLMDAMGTQGRILSSSWDERKLS